MGLISEFDRAELRREIRQCDRDGLLRPVTNPNGGWLEATFQSDAPLGSRWTVSTGEGPGNAWGRHADGGHTIYDPVSLRVYLDAGCPSDDDRYVEPDGGVTRQWVREHIDAWERAIVDALDGVAGDQGSRYEKEDA